MMTGISDLEEKAFGIPPWLRKELRIAYERSRPISTYQDEEEEPGKGQKKSSNKRSNPDQPGGRNKKSKKDKPACWDADKPTTYSTTVSSSQAIIPIILKSLKKLLRHSTNI